MGTTSFTLRTKTRVETNGELDEYSVLVLLILPVVVVAVVVVVFKPVETRTVFSRDIIHYLKRPLSLPRPS